MLKICHVGARDGFIPFDYPAIFDSCCEFIMIDAANVGKINSIMLLNGRSVSSEPHQIQSVVWNEDTHTQLNLTVCPYAASVKSLEEKFNDWYVFANGDCDYILGQAHAIAITETVETKTLNTILTEANFPNPGVLCIDVQGSSFEVLQGASSCLDWVDAVICEVELIPFYGGNPSFSEILNFLTAKGMIFSHFIPEPVSWATPVRQPVGFRSKTMLGSADAVFIRSPDQINSDLDFSRVLNYALISCALGHLDLALSALQKVDLSCANKGYENPIHSFCSDLVIASSSMPHFFPPSFLEAKKSRKTPPIDKVLFDETTPIESCLRRYQFEDLADAVKNLRHYQIKRLSNSEDQ